MNLQSGKVRVAGSVAYCDQRPWILNTTVKVPPILLFCLSILLPSCFSVLLSFCLRVSTTSLFSSSKCTSSIIDFSYVTCQLSTNHIIFFYRLILPQYKFLYDRTTFCSGRSMTRKDLIAHCMPQTWKMISKCCQEAF
jgi:hypothetical protein